MVQVVEQDYTEKMAMYMSLDKEVLVKMLIECNRILSLKPLVVMPKQDASIRFCCTLCGRDKFTHKQPHKCVGGFRKRGLEWREILI